MSEVKPNTGKGKAFFDQGDQVAETGNWDYAIDMYREGIAREPDNLERGFKKLREVALARKARGGKGPKGADRKTAKMGKDPIQNLANAAFLWAKDPGSESLMEQLVKMAQAAEQPEVVRWIADIIIESQLAKPNKRICLMLTDITEKMEMFDLAVKACQLAFKASPSDAALEARIGRLGASYTIWRGKYGEEGDFREKVKDMDAQTELMQEDSLVKSDAHLRQAIAKARKEYHDEPLQPGKINGYVDTLLRYEDDEHEAEAIKVLEEAYATLKAFQFKMRIGDIRIRQFQRKFRALRDAGDMPGATKVAKEQLLFEVQEYADRVKNYPTDLALKFELGRRLFLVGKYDDAIGMLQQAQRDPRRFIATMNYMGQAFMKKQWWQEAIDTFQRVLERDISEDAAKELRYNLGLAFERLGLDNKDLESLKKAEHQFSEVAQTDFNFKDVREKLEAVRAAIKNIS